MSIFDYDKGVARGNLCRLVAACYYEPGPEFAEEGVFQSILDAATRLGPDLAEQARRLGEAFSAEASEELLVDYARLFLGPGELVASPYGSSWMSAERALMQDSTMAVLELYRTGGFEIDEEFRELPDHIAAELEFLYLLIHRENQAHLVADAEALGRTRALRKRFLNEHLAAWIGPFTAAVRGGAKSAFYRELAEITHRLVSAEASADAA